MRRKPEPAGPRACLLQSSMSTRPQAPVDTPWAALGLLGRVSLFAAPNTPTSGQGLCLGPCAPRTRLPRAASPDSGLQPKCSFLSPGKDQPRGSRSRRKEPLLMHHAETSARRFSAASCGPFPRDAGRLGAAPEQGHGLARAAQAPDAAAPGSTDRAPRTPTVGGETGSGLL